MTFIPVGSKNSRGGSGTTDASGVFTITDLDQNLPGLPSGKYIIAYSMMRLPDGSAAPEPDPDKPGIIQIETLPEHLQTPDENVSVEIPQDGNTKLELKISLKK
jgi:hypothetical protein